MAIYNDLVDSIRKLEKVIVAFSGGVDSTLVLKAAHDALGDQVKAITIVSPYIPQWEVEEAKAFTTEHQIKHDFIHVGIAEAIRFNPEDRCYVCKKYVFQLIKEKAVEEDYPYILDGTNFDDTKDYRPGMKALKELEVISPLLENLVTKAAIRQMSKEIGLPTWDKPAYACLATRIPVGDELNETTLRQIEKAEKYIMDFGIKAVRVRAHGDLARVEVDPLKRELLCHPEILDQVSKAFKEIGFKYVTLDMAGYKMGSMNQEN